MASCLGQCPQSYKRHEILGIRNLAYLSARLSSYQWKLSIADISTLKILCFALSNSVLTEHILVDYVIRVN